MSSNPLRRIGVLTGGGDCPGLNAVIRAVTKDALHHGIEVVGIEDGFLGLIENRTRPLGYEDVSEILTLGGTILGSSNRANPLRFEVAVEPDGTPLFANVIDRCMATIEAAQLDAVVVIGGDGTMTCAEPLHERGVAVVGVPKTIDNDIVGTEMTFGFQTAVATATDALDKVHTTAQSHHRALVVEVMGRNAGWLALHAGVASGSDVILLPEIPFDPKIVCDFVERRAGYGKRYTILCVSEGCFPEGGERVIRELDPGSPDPVRLGGVGRVIAKMIEDRTPVDARHVVLGHVQRGGSPVAGDRVLSTQLGHAAMELLRGGSFGRMVAVQRGRLTSVELTQPAHKQRLVDPSSEPLVRAARAVYTSFGDGRSPRANL